MDVLSARALLGVSPSADADQIKRAFRRLAREAHPDRGGSPDTFRRLVVAQRLALGAAGPQRRPGNESWMTEPLSGQQSTASGAGRPRRRAASNPPAAKVVRFGDVLARQLAAA